MTKKLVSKKPEVLLQILWLVSIIKYPIIFRISSKSVFNIIGEAECSTVTVVLEAIEFGHGIYESISECNRYFPAILLESVRFTFIIKSYEYWIIGFLYFTIFRNTFYCKVLQNLNFHIYLVWWLCGS